MATGKYDLDMSLVDWGYVFQGDTKFVLSWQLKEAN